MGRMVCFLGFMVERLYSRRRPSGSTREYVRFSALLSKKTCACVVEDVGTRMVYWFRSQAHEPKSSLVVLAMMATDVDVWVD